ncbi:MAG: hypothetical protein KDK99_07665 [Verrucomicrobiales bacterium]|nr:hypothetical protein [Verrucomicrobiales bacterium]
MPRRSTTSSAAAAAVADFDEISSQNNVLRFDASPELSLTVGADEEDLGDYDSKVKEAQERISRLRQEKEELERQQRRFEELRQKQEKFAKGKRDLVEKIGRSVTQMDRELYDAQKLVEEISSARDSFAGHLEVLRSLQPERWNRAQIDEELENALSAIEDAEDEYAKGVRRVASCRRSEAAALSAPHRDEEGFSPTASPLGSGADTFSAWAWRGLGFTLPLMGALLIGLLLAKLLF